MSHSLKEWVDTNDFAVCLQLDPGIQQDVHEFYKLIIDFLEVGGGGICGKREEEIEVVGGRGRGVEVERERKKKERNRCNSIRWS